MKRSLSVALLLIFSMTACRRPQPQAAQAASAPLKVGLVFDVGGRGDKSFNDSAFRGLQRAAKELGIKYDYIEPAEPADRENALRQFASGDYPLIIAVGFIFTDDVNRVAEAFPKKHFACVDYALEPGQAVPPNVVALKFREQESSFLGGVIAALTSKTKTIGFVGGMDVPLIHKFEAGYRAGAAWADAKVKVLVSYAGVTPQAFKDPAKGEEIALSQIAQGADIIYHASGSTGLGVFEAAREKHILAMGVDSDQYKDAPGFVLTSITKNVDEAVFQVIQRQLEGKFKGGVIELGLKEKGVGYVYDEHNKALIPARAREQAERARALIVADKLQVPFK
ncbi:MAG: BMP family ABC transporter substrate-binding protein [Elusimicrobia bacterium]|nr:BMP family ABC transporter substrate-binding protein [Elusimicrobiota bacterium]MDE2237328.1 BMP family ABC transporter substrate-binding protein [Elusimicrobiota bacterium]MDE2426022.1 BMP family ABC transporter substrate-binding protein [Elusimicrobiota bacterium]